jgi:hypothetical protein
MVSDLLYYSSEATDDSSIAIPTNNISVLIDEEEEQDEINATTPTDIKKEQLANISKQAALFYLM